MTLEAGTKLGRYEIRSSARSWRQIWSAPAERSGDGALDYVIKTLIQSGDLIQGWRDLRSLTPG